MRRLETTITQKGQVTIPLDVRRAVGLKPRDKVTFEVQGDVIKMRRAPSRVMTGYGAIVPKKRPEDFKETREEFEEGVANDVLSET